jgi:hypothetical protein
MPFTKEELDAFDAALAPFEGKLAQQQAKRGAQNQRVIDQRKKPSQAQLRRHEISTRKNAEFWKNWEPK